MESIRSGRSEASECSAGLGKVRRRLAAAAAGEGGVVYLEGPPESGKSQLVAGAAESARAAGMRVLTARGRDLEREFSFGVALQLFEEAWFAAGEQERTALLEGPARWAGELISGSIPADQGFAADRAYVVIHGLFWLARMLAGDGTDATSERPLALIVDDVDRADGPSLRFLAYLAARVGDLPIAVVVAARPVPSSADPSGLCGVPPVVSALRRTSELILLAPVPSSLSAVADAPARASRPELVELPAVAGAGAVAAQMALRKSLAGGHRESVIDLAELAWGDGALLESDEDAPSWASAVEALLGVDELERAIEIADAAHRAGLAGGGLPAGAHHCHGWSLYHQGRITAALAVAEAALAAQPDTPRRAGCLPHARWRRGDSTTPRRHSRSSSTARASMTRGPRCCSTCALNCAWCSCVPRTRRPTRWRPAVAQRALGSSGPWRRGVAFDRGTGGTGAWRHAAGACAGAGGTRAGAGARAAACGRP